MKELNNCNMTIVYHDNKSYAFDYIQYEMIQLDENKKKIFEALISKKTLPTDFENKKDLIDVVKIIKSGYFFSEKPIILYADDNIKKSVIISFPIVHACNLKCKYCFAKSGTIYQGKNKLISVELINKIFNNLPDIFGQKPEYVRIEFVSGGETLLEQDVYKKIVSYITEIASDMKMEVSIFSLTNGTLLNQHIIDFINMNNSMLGISIDGPKALHDYHRPFKDGKGSYDIVIKNICDIQEHNKSNNIYTVSVVTSKTKSLVEILNHNINLGIKSMEMRIMRGEDDYGLSVSQGNINHYKLLYHEFAEYLKMKPDDLMFIINDYDTFGKLVKRLLVGEKVIYRCQAGRNKLSFTADGDIYPCDSFVGHKEYMIGNIYEMNLNVELRDRFINADVDHNDKCKKCAYRYLCGGDCYYNSAMNGHSMLMCSLKQYLCETAIDLVWFIKNTYPDKYKKYVSFAKLRYVIK